MPRIENMTIQDLGSLIIPASTPQMTEGESDETKKVYAGRTFSNLINFDNLYIYLKRMAHAIFYFEFITNESIAKELNNRVTKLNLAATPETHSAAILEAEQIKNVMEACRVNENDEDFQELAQRINTVIKHLNLPPSHATPNLAQQVSSNVVQESSLQESLSFLNEEEPPPPLLKLPLNEPPPLALDKSFAQTEAASLFALMNLGSAHIEPSDIIRNSVITLSFTAKTLKSMLTEGLIPPHEKQAVSKLIHFYTIATEVRNMHNQLSLLTETEAIIDQKKVISKYIVDQLKQNEEIYLATGYAKKPFGHAIGLKLVLVPTQEGPWIRGEIYNRGEGANLYHGHLFVHGLKEKVAPLLTLDPVPFDQFESCGFLNALHELVFASYPLPKDNKLLTKYSIKDFYEVVLPFWPGFLVQSGQKQTARSWQRGGTCSLKTALMPIKENLSSYTAASVKLKMRIDSTLEHLAINTFDPANIPELEWVSMKINRALEKLMKNQKAEQNPASCEVLTQSCAVLTQKIQEKITDLHLKEKKELEKTFGTLSHYFIDRTDYQITTPYASTEVSSNKEKTWNFKNKPIKELIKESLEFLLFIYDHRSKGLRDEIKYLITQYLTAFLNASEEEWLLIDLDQSDMINGLKFLVSDIIPHLIKAVAPKTDTKGYLKATTMQIFLISNVLAHVLKKLKTSKSVSENYLDYHAQILLRFLTDAGAQLRVYHPEASRNLKTTLRILKEVATGTCKIPPLKWDRDPDTFYIHLMKIPYPSMVEVSQDPVIKHVYDSLIKEPSYQLKGVGNYIPVDLIDRAVAVHGLHSYDKGVPNAELNEMLVTLLNPLIMTLGASGQVNGGCWISYDYEYDTKCMAPVRSVGLHSFKTDDTANPSHGLLCDAHFPWDFSEVNSGMSEREVAKHLLDNRMRGEKSLPRKSQNEQVLIGRQSLIFGKTVLPPDEYEELLAIMTSDDTLIPQCLHYFKQHFFRLKDPRFQALFEAFLWTLHSDGDGPVLERILADPHSQIGDHLLSFLEDRIKICRQGGLTSQQLALTRILAQTFAFLYSSEVKQRGERAKLCLKESVCSLFIAGQQKPKQDPRIQGWIVSLYPYIAQDEDLLDLCRRVNVNIVNKIRDLKAGEHFDHRQIVQDDFETGAAFLLPKNSDAPEGRLPSFVLASDHYILSNKNPIVKKIPSQSVQSKLAPLSLDVYEFEEEGIPTRVTCTHDYFKLSQLKKDSRGNLRWFSYIPDASFPKIESLPDFHPCSKGILAKGTEKWFSEEDASNLPPETLIISQQDKTLLCRVTDRIIKGDQPELTLATAYTSSHPFLQKLLSLDNPCHILIWKDKDHCLRQFEFPRLGLKLEYKEGAEGLQWQSNYPGYFLDATTTVADLDPYRHYVVLKNKSGKKIVVMPDTLLAPPEEPLILSKPHFKTFISEKPQVLVYQLDRKGRLIPSFHPLKILYLIHLAFVKCDYKQVRKLLKKLDLHPAQWNKMEAEEAVKSWMNPHQHPYACALRVKLRLIVARSTQDIGEKFDLEGQKEDYFACLDQINSLGPDWLSAQDELETIKRLKSQTIKKEKILILNQRLDELKNQHKTSAPNWHILPSPNSAKPFVAAKDFTRPECFKNETAHEMISYFQKPLPLALLMRPGKNFCLNFFYYYRIAYEGQHLHPQAFKDLMALLQLTQGDQDFSVQYFRLALLTIATKDKYTCVLRGKEILAHCPTPQALVDAAKAQRIEEVTSQWTILSPCQGKEGLPQWTFTSRLNKTPLLAKTLINKTLFRRFICTKRLRLLAKKINDVFDVKSLLDRLSFGNAAKINRSTQRLIRDEVAAQEYTAFTKPPLKRSALVKEVINYCLVPQDPMQHRYKCEQELADLESLKNFYEKKYASSSSRILQGIKKEMDTCKATLLKIEQGVQTHCLNLFSEQNKGTCAADKDKQAKELQERLENTLNEAKEKLALAKEALVAKIQFYPPYLKKQVDSGLIQPMGMKELIACFGRQDDASILHANPSLKEGLAEIKQQLTQYLVAQTEYLVLEGSKNILCEVRKIANKEGWESSAAANASLRFVNALTAKRAYTSDDPAFEALLVFEALANMRLRKDQVEALVTLTSDNLIEVEFEASTGFGKSQVMIPLWLFLTSRKSRLTMMTVPMALLPDQLLLLKEMLGNMFFTGVQAINFDREKACNLTSLKNLNEQLKQARNQKRMTLIGIKPLHGLSGLGLKQALFANTSKKPDDIVLELIKLRKLLSSGVSDFVDESRECLDVRQRYDYAIGQLKPVDTKYCKEMGRFYTEVILHPSILQHWDFEFIPKENSREQSTRTKTIVTQEQFENRDQTSLAVLLAERMVNYLQVEESEQEAMKNHLLGIRDKRADAYIKKMEKNPKQLALYKLCCRQMVTHLPRTLSKKCHESYDLSKNRLAIPSHRGEVKLSSEFAHLDDLINFTIQANLKIDLDTETIEQFVDHLKNLLLSNDALVLENELYQLFLEIQKKLNLPPLGVFAEADRATLQWFLNSSDGFNERLKFIAAFILPRIAIYPKKISGTPYTLIESIHHVQAASGTPDPDVLPPRIKAIENPAAPIRNLLAIWKHSSVTTTSISHPLELFKSLISKKNPHRVIIDTAGYFRDLSHDTIAEAIFQRPSDDWDTPINGFAYYDNAGNALILERGSKTPIPREDSSLPAEEVMIYIRQSKTIGSNTLMASTAKGWVTVGRDTTENLLLQGAGRMRGLSTGQTVDFVTMDEDAGVIKNTLEIKEITLEHILRYVQMNEAKQKKCDYAFSLRLYLEHLIEKELWREIDRPTKLIERFKALESVLVETTETNPMDAPSPFQETLSPQQVIDLLKTTLLDPLKANEAIAKIVDVAAIETAFDQHVDLSKMPQQTKMHMGRLDEVSVEVEHETMDEATQELDQIGEEATNLPFISFTPSQPLEWNGDYAKAFSGKTQKVVGLSLYTSPNFTVLQKDQDLADKIRKPVYQHVLRVNPKTNKVDLLMVDLHDMAAVLHKMQDNRRNGTSPTSSKYHYYLVAKGQILASDAPGTPLLLSEVLKGDTLIQAELLGKILSADKFLTAAESRWIKHLHPEQTTELLDFANDYLSVWPHLRPLVDQINKYSEKADL